MAAGNGTAANNDRAEHQRASAGPTRMAEIDPAEELRQGCSSWSLQCGQTSMTLSDRSEWGIYVIAERFTHQESFTQSSLLFYTWIHLPHLEDSQHPFKGSTVIRCF